MEGGVLFTCRYCGGGFSDLSAHYSECAAKRRAAAAEDLRRLEEMEAAAAPGVVSEAFKEAAVSGQAFIKGGRVLKSEEVLAPVKGKGGRPRKHADRRAYMRAYMRARRGGG